MLAIIPARGGSKGLPGKNIRMLAGKPLIAYAIESAQGCHLIDRIIVSTDSEAIAHTARQWGADVPGLRPPNLATDDSPAIDTYLFEITKEEKRRGQEVTELTVLLPTAPLRTANDVTAAIQLFRERGADSVISYTEAHHPIAWHRRLDEEHRIVNIWQEELLHNRQEVGKTYYPNGAIYVFRHELLRQRQYTSRQSFAYLMPRSRSVDIDTIEDFQWAEYFLANYE